MDWLPILRLSSSNKFLIEENERVERNDFEKIAATFRKFDPFQFSVTNEAVSITITRSQRNQNPTGKSSFGICKHNQEMIEKFRLQLLCSALP